MSAPSDTAEDWESLRASVMGLGEQSIHKSYYPELQRRITELERSAQQTEEAMHALRASEERYRNIAESISDVVWILDPTTMRLIYVSPSVEKLRGYTPEEVMASSVEESLLPQYVESVRQEIAIHLQAVQSGRAAAGVPHTIEVEQTCKNGEAVWTEIVASVRINAETGRPEIHGVTREITDRKLAEARQARSLLSIADMLGQVAEARDPYTAGHQRRVAELAVQVAAELGMTAPQIEEIRIAALIHDVGKIAVPAEILSKPGQLLPIEFELIKAHCEAGYQIISSAQMEGNVAEIVYQHHERCDGSGYPRQLVGSELLDSANVVAVADVVEAMSTHRPYRPALGVDTALSEIRQGAGSRYDGEVVAACESVFAAGFVFAQ